MANDDWVKWHRPRPPLQRLMSFCWEHTSYDWGGVWMFESVFNMDAANEYWELRRVMSAKIGGVTGDTTKIWRGTHENGGVRVWRSDLIDPVYTKRGDDPTTDMVCRYRAAVRAEQRCAKEIDKHFMAAIRKALKSDDTGRVDSLLAACPSEVTTVFMRDAVREHYKSIPKKK